MAYFYCQIRTRTRIPVICRIFPLVQILIPWWNRMKICSWDRDLSLKWIKYPFGKGIQIWIWASGNMFCIILCSHRVWNPSQSLNPSPEVEISHNIAYFKRDLFWTALNLWDATSVEITQPMTKVDSKRTLRKFIKTRRNLSKNSLPSVSKGN